MMSSNYYYSFQSDRDFEATVNHCKNSVEKRQLIVEHQIKKLKKTIEDRVEELEDVFNDEKTLFPILSRFDQQK